MKKTISLLALLLIFTFEIQAQVTNVLNNFYTVWVKPAIPIIGSRINCGCFGQHWQSSWRFTRLSRFYYKHCTLSGCIFLPGWYRGLYYGRLMKSYRIFKDVNKQPYILGLRLSLFYLYILFLIIVIFLLSTGITLFKLVSYTIILIVGYLVLNKLNSGALLGSISNERFPNTIINDNYN